MWLTVKKKFQSALMVLTTDVPFLLPTHSREKNPNHHSFHFKSAIRK